MSDSGSVTSNMFVNYLVDTTVKQILSTHSIAFTQKLYIAPNIAAYSQPNAGLLSLSAACDNAAYVGLK